MSCVQLMNKSKTQISSHREKQKTKWLVLDDAPKDVYHSFFSVSSVFSVAKCFFQNNVGSRNLNSWSVIGRKEGLA